MVVLVHEEIKAMEEYRKVLCLQAKYPRRVELSVLVVDSWCR